MLVTFNVGRIIPVIGLLPISANSGAILRSPAYSTSEWINDDQLQTPRTF